MKPLAFSLVVLFAFAAGAEPPFVKPEHSRPVEASEVGEAMKILSSLAEKDRDELVTKEIVVAARQDGDEPSGVITAYVVVHQPKKRVFEMLTDTTAQVNYQPRLRKSERVRREGNVEVTQFHTKAPMVNVHTRVIHQWWPEVSRIAWVLDPEFKNDLKKQVGFYNLYAIDEKTTLLEFGTIIEVGMLVPKFVQTYFTRKDLPEALGNVKRWVDSNGEWRAEK